MTPFRALLGALPLALGACVASPEPARRPATRPAEPGDPLPRFETTVRVEEPVRPPSPALHEPEQAESRPASGPSRALPPRRAGERVLERWDGRLSKFYSVRADQGVKFGNYIAKYCGLPEGAVEVLQKADLADFRNLREADPAKVRGQTIEISDWIVVTGTPEEIDRVDRFYGLYYASVPQIEIEARVAEITSTSGLDFGSLFNLDRLSGAHQVLVDQFDTNFPSQSSATTGVLGNLDLFTVQDSTQYKATLHFLETQQGVDFISNPRIAVRTGARAEIVTGTEIPYLESQTIQGSTIISAIKYKVVGVKLYVVPYLTGADVVTLEVELEVSAQTGFSNLGGDVVNPVISTRIAKTLVHVRNGETFVVGGLLASNEVETENRVPILGSIPLLGYLFRSTLTQKQTTDVLFFLTPRVIADETGPAGLVVPPVE
ncbi:MAG: hypothetical protein L0323_17110 [Planctomycetes bacterium]|nr:hypothetical protein [Planctomycetota bacterium]